MAAPSTPVIQGVSSVYPFGSNVHATWVTSSTVTSCATTLYSGSTVVSTQAASLFDSDAYTKTWKVSYAIAATGTYAIGVTATNGDGTSDEATAQFVVADYSGIVLSPSGTVTGLPINVAWSIDDPNGVAAQNILVAKSDYSRVLYSSVLPPTQRTLTLGTADLAGIEDDTSYEIRLHVTNGVGLVTTATSTITTSWQPPVTPTATVSTDPDTLAASVTVTGDRSYTFTDVESFTAPESGVITSLAIDGKSVQDGTPTPSAPVAIKSVAAPNLAPFFSTALSDSTYWFTTTNLTTYGTLLTDGWVQFSTFSVNLNVSPKSTALIGLKGSTAYTVLIEVKDSTVVGEVSCFIYTQANSMLANSARVVIAGDGVYRIMANTKADPYDAGITHFRLFIDASASGASFAGKVRVSLFEGLYAGGYAPVGSIGATTVGKNASTLIGGLGCSVITNTVLAGNNIFSAICKVEPNTNYTVSYTGGNRLVIAGVDRYTNAGGPVDVIWYNTDSAVSPRTFNSGAHDLVVLYLSSLAAYPVSSVQVEKGTTATTYEPYSGIMTPIDLQGHALRSLPDGTHDELTVDSAGVVTLTQRVGETTQAVTDGVTGTVGVDVLSSTGQIANGAQVDYKLATEQTISLGTITPPFVAEGATVAIDATVTPTLDATMRAAQSAGTPPTATLMVVRVSPDGTRHVLADNLESGDTVTDPLPPLGVEYSYEVTGIAATGVPSTPATIAHTNVTTCWAMNFGTGAAEVVLARFNPKASYSVEQGGEAYHFADGGEGDGLPVWYGTTERDVSGAATWDTLTHATADRLNALMLRYPVGWLRDPFGHRWRAHMKPKFSHGIGKLWQVSVDWDAVRWVEA